jgi:hypothetical protein
MPVPLANNLSLLSSKELEALLSDADYFQIDAKDLMSANLDHLNLSAEALSEMRSKFFALRSAAAKRRHLALVRCYRRLLVKIECLLHQLRVKQTEDELANALRSISLADRFNMPALKKVPFGRYKHVSDGFEQRRKSRKHFHGNLAVDLREYEEGCDED